jgi:hypothetical protein
MNFTHASAPETPKFAGVDDVRRDRRCVRSVTPTVAGGVGRMLEMARSNSRNIPGAALLR